MGWRCLAASNLAQPRGASRSAPSLRDAARRPGHRPVHSRAFWRAGHHPLPTRQPGQSKTQHPVRPLRECSQESAGTVCARPRGPARRTLRVRKRGARRPPGRTHLPRAHTCPPEGHRDDVAGGARGYWAGTVCGAAQVSGAAERPRSEAEGASLRDGSRSARSWTETGDRVRLEREPISSSLQGDIPCNSVDVDREVLVAGSGGRRGKDAGAASSPQGVGQGAASFQFFGIVASEKGGRWRTR